MYIRKELQLQVLLLLLLLLVSSTLVIIVRLAKRGADARILRSKPDKAIHR